MDDEENNVAPIGVYNFDPSKYKKGAYRLITAVDALVQLHGRFLVHKFEECTRKTKINSVQFDWPGCAFSLCFRQSKVVEIRLKGEGNYFNVFLDGQFQCILQASLNATCYRIVEFENDADVDMEHIVTITKRTEPQMRGAMSTFKVCTFYGFLVDSEAQVLPCNIQFDHKIEFIGDSDTCAFGNEGQSSSANAIFGMKGRMENVYNGYASITARMFNADHHILAWSG